MQYIVIFKSFGILFSKHFQEIWEISDNKNPVLKSIITHKNRENNLPFLASAPIIGWSSLSTGLRAYKREFGKYFDLDFKPES